MRRCYTLPSSHRPTALPVGFHCLAIARHADGGGLLWGRLAHHPTARPHTPSGGAHLCTPPLRSRLFGPGGHFRRWMADCQVRGASFSSKPALPTGRQPTPLALPAPSPLFLSIGAEVLACRGDSPGLLCSPAPPLRCSPAQLLPLPADHPAPELQNRPPCYQDHHPGHRRLPAAGQASGGDRQLQARRGSVGIGQALPGR